MTIREAPRFGLGPVGFGKRRGNEIDPYAGEQRQSNAQEHVVEYNDGFATQQLASHRRTISVEGPDTAVLFPCEEPLCVTPTARVPLEGEAINSEPIVQQVIVWSETKPTDIVTMAAIQRYQQG